jgi:hypothetical protein
VSFARAAECYRNPILKESTVGQAGESIVISQKLHPLFCNLALGNIFSCAFVEQDVSVRITRCPNIRNYPPFRAILSVDFHFGALDNAVLLRLTDD